MPYNRKVELAWAAGFFDGEGCTTAHQGYGKQRLQPRMRVSQASTTGMPFVLKRFLKAVKIGKLYGPYKGTIKPQYTWAVTTPNDVKIAVKVLRPFLSPVKRRQIAKCFSAFAADRKLW